MEKSKIFKRLFDPVTMLGKAEVMGPLPSGRQAFGRMFSVAWPSAMEMVLITLVSLVDTAMVSILGTGAIAAVGITNQPKFIVMALFQALNVGVTAVVARRRGQEDPEGANRCLRQALLMALVLCVLLAAVAGMCAWPLLRFAGAQEDIIQDAVTYYRIILCGVPFTVVGMTINAAQKGVGNTKISMRTNVTANLVNVVFNYLLIGGNLGFPRLGVAGAAIATAIGNAASLVMSVISVRHPGNFLYLRMNESFLPDRRTLSSLVSVGGSAAVEQVCLRVGFFLYAKIVAELGTVAFATHQVCMNIMHLSTAFGDGLSVAGASLCGQSLGQKRPDLAMLYGKVGQRYALACAAVMMVFFVVAGSWVVGFFSDDPSVIYLGTRLLWIVALTAPGQTTQMLYAGLLRGSGDTRFIAVCSFISVTIVRPFFSWGLCYPLGFGLIGAWVGMLLDQYCRTAITLWRFHSGKWTKIEV